MKSLRKSILTLLALTLFGGAGAWAQGPTTVFEVDFSSNPPAITGSMLRGNGMSISAVRIHNNVDLIKSIEMGVQYNYSDNCYVSIKPATGSFKKGDTLLIAVCYNYTATKTAQADIYAADGTTKLFTTALGINGKTESGDPVVEKFVLGQDADSLLFGGSSSSNTFSYVTTLKVLRPASIELTKAGANQWSLGQTPDYDLELQVEYYEAHALKNIPAGWTVLVNGVPQTQPYQGDSLLITETDSVTLMPDGNPRRVKSVTLEDDVVLVTIDGITLDITGCTTWAQIIARNPGVIWDDGGFIDSGQGLLDLGGAFVYTSAPYDPAQQSNYQWLQ